MNNILYSAGQERVSVDSAPSRVSAPNCRNDHGSTTNWRKIIIQVSLYSHANVVTRVELTKSRPAVIGGFLLAVLILLESGIKLRRN